MTTNIHAYRRRFAQELYEYRSGRPLPPVEGRLRAADFDRQAAEYGSCCLGHNRVDVIFGSYIRQQRSILVLILQFVKSERESHSSSTSLLTQCTNCVMTGSLFSSY